MRALNFAHGAIYTLGAYALLAATSLYGSHLTSLALGITAAFFFCAVIGIVIERFFFRRFMGELIPQIIVVLGIMNILTGSTQLIFGAEDRGISPIINGAIHLRWIVMPYSRLFVAILAGMVMVALILFIRYFKFGYFLRAVAGDSLAASLQGVRLGTVWMIGFGLSCALAGLAGSLATSLYNVANPWVGDPVLMSALLVVLLGGMGSISGALLGSLILGFLDSFTLTYIATGGISTLLGFVVVYFILLFRPQGLMGQPQEI